MFGQMEEDMMETGLITKCMVEVHTNGTMGDHMKVNTSLIKNTDLDVIPGLMERNTWDNGRIVRGMEGEK